MIGLWSLLAIAVSKYIRFGTSAPVWTVGVAWTLGNVVGVFSRALILALLWVWISFAFVVTVGLLRLAVPLAHLGLNSPDLGALKGNWRWGHLAPNAAWTSTWTAWIAWTTVDAQVIKLNANVDTVRKSVTF